MLLLEENNSVYSTLITFCYEIFTSVQNMNTFLAQTVLKICKMMERKNGTVLISFLQYQEFVQFHFLKEAILIALSCSSSIPVQLVHQMLTD